MDFRRCWRNSARWSGNNPAATKRPRRRGIRKWIEPFPFILFLRSKLPPRSRAFFLPSLISLSLLLFFEAIGIIGWQIWIFLSTSGIFIPRLVHWTNREKWNLPETFSRNSLLTRIVKFSLLFFSRFSPERRDCYPRLPRYLTVLPFFLYVHFVIATLVTLTHIFYSY